MSFELYPAIDLRGGRCVRLVQGDYARQVTYEVDPVDVARSFEAAGARWIHVVDLDAARSGSAENHNVIGAIAAAVGVPVQSGGGVRSVAAAESLYAAGVARVVVGTAAVENPEVIDELVAAGRSVAVGLDVRGDEVAIRGWEQASGLSIFELLSRFVDVGVEAVIVTQIDNDGMGGGSDVAGLSSVLAATGIPVIASGGVGSASDIESLTAVEVNGRTLSGVIVGKALHDGALGIEEALVAAGVGV